MIPVWRLKGNFGELFSPLMLVPGIEVRSSGLKASTFTQGTIFTRLFSNTAYLQLKKA